MACRPPATEITLRSLRALRTMFCTSSRDRGCEIPTTRVELSWEWISLTRIGSDSGVSPLEAPEAATRAAEPTMNSRLEIIYPLNLLGTYGATLEQERHETPRAPHVLFVSLPECRSERSFLDGDAIGIGEPQAGETGGKPQPISECQTESKQRQKGATIGRMTDIAVRPRF